MINNFQEQARQMGAAGEMLIDVDPVKGFFRVKLRNIKPENALPEFTKSIASAVSFCGKSLNLTVKEHVAKEGESNG
ncbi:MAG: hypothetical protein AMXMBFR85_06370 [Dehalococcoides mccartyi]|nr:hypothetical protein [Dehalococcoides mccartyi]